MDHVIVTEKSHVHYTVSRKKMKNMRIRVKGDGCVAVSAPFCVSENHIKDFVFQNAAFIVQRQQHIEAQRQRSYPASYENGDSFLFLGRRIGLKVERAENQSAVNIENLLVLRVPEHMDAKQVFSKWMARMARSVFAERIAKAAPLFGEKGISLSVRSMLTRWGSINTRRRRMSLTVHLLRCEMELIDYVIVHELCHLQNARHGRKFYSTLERHYPNRRALDKRLKQFGLVDF